MNITEGIILALDSVKTNKLRAFLTLLSVAIGVFAIIGAGTLTSSIDNAVTKEMAALGENTFSFKRFPSIMTGNDWRRLRHRKPITYSQLKEFKKLMESTDKISGYSISQGNTIKSGNNSTDPNVLLIGTDEHYFSNNNLTLSSGRTLNPDDILLNSNVAIIGNDVVVKLFPYGNPLFKTIRIKNQNFTVVGVLESKGAVLGQSQDNQVIIPLTYYLKYYTSEWEESINITIKAESRESLQPTIDEAIGFMRIVRGVKPWEENSFEIETNESIGEQFSQFTGFLNMFGLISGIIALIAAGVGIMNIMLVSVKERTREIGIRKAVGAKKSWIMMQFVIESITLCQMGGIIGILIGIIMAFLLGKLININIIFPAGWVAFSLIVCTFLGVLFGTYPAWKAANLDPIEALRYE